MKNKLPKLTREKKKLFAKCGAFEKLEFGGTDEEWKKVNKEIGWDDDCGKYLVDCEKIIKF